MNYDTFRLKLREKLATEQEFLTLHTPRKFTAKYDMRDVLVVPSSEKPRPINMNRDFYSIWKKALKLKPDERWHPNNYEGRNNSYVLTLIKDIVGDQDLE